MRNFTDNFPAFMIQRSLNSVIARWYRKGLYVYEGRRLCVAVESIISAYFSQFL